MTPAFFETGKTYRHGNELGSEAIFDVRYVGTAPGPFEHHSETLGVAFGWLWGPGPDGTWEGLGSYSTPDFADWEEVTPPPCGARASYSALAAAVRVSCHSTLRSATSGHQVLSRECWPHLTSGLVEIPT